jgi:enterochelin esterase-like enzyme
MTLFSIPWGTHCIMCCMNRAVLFLAAAVAYAQPAPPSPIISPEVHTDRTVTFRFRAPHAALVNLNLEGSKAVPMEKDDATGVWSFTTAALDPDIYGYTFNADGVGLMDPNNSLMKPNLISNSSAVHIPGPDLLWEVSGTAHGDVHHHFYHSALVGDDRSYYVYTPPGYERGTRKYPVLYLLHGYSDDASGWSAVGHANIILDNLIAQQKAKPMIIVMPLGYGPVEAVIPRMVKADNFRSNILKFRETLLTEVIPQVERAYRVDARREARAIAGLSMGGAESLTTGLNNLEKFGWIGSFSAGGMGEDYDVLFPKLDTSANNHLSVLWIACGTEDRLIGTNRKFRDFLTSKSIKFTPIETPGMHTWMVWRRNLAAFAPLLFQ